MGLSLPTSIEWICSGIGPTIQSTGRELCIFAKMLYLNSCNARDLTQKALGHYYYCWNSILSKPSRDFQLLITPKGPSSWPLIAKSESFVSKKLFIMIPKAVTSTYEKSDDIDF